MAFLVQGSPIITDERDLSAVGVATLTEDINIGRLLYDANGNVGAADSVLVTKDNILQWVAPASIGISTGSALAPGSTYFVTENGSNSNSGDSLNNAWATIGYALTNITVSGDDVLIIGAGDYEETFPLTVPAGLTVKGAGQRATIIRPSAATKNENGFLLNNDTTIEDLSIGDMKKGVTNSYAFSYASGAALTTRSPYISRVSIINRGDTQTAADPYGFNTADNPGVTEIGAGGFLIDGSVLDASTVSPSMLLNEVTIFPVKNVGIEMKNGTRAEILNSFVYFADEGIKGESDLATGLAGAGKARLTLDNPSATPVAGNTIEYYDTDGTTVLASGTVDSVSGNYVTLTDSGTGEFVVPRNRIAVPVNFVGTAELSSTQAKFGPTSLNVTGANSDLATAEGSAFGFGANEFTVEGWFYFDGLTTGHVLFDFRNVSAGEGRFAVEVGSGNSLDLTIANTTILSGGTLTTGSWIHVAVARDATTLRLFLDGTVVDSAANNTDLGTTGTLHLGADYQDSNGVNAYIDDFRVVNGAAKYTSGFTAPTSTLVGDKDTTILLHFDGSDGDTTTTDDVVVLQDIRFTGGNTADKISLADYSEFGADLRSIGCAVEYGNRGVVGDGQGVTLRLISINFNHIGAGGDFSNDQNLVIQANEVIETNSAEVSYVSIDQKGDFRVGESFYVDQENGTVSFNETVTDLTSLNSLTITNGTDSSVITPTSGRFGNVQISGNQIESTTGDLNLNTAGAGDVNINSDLNVVGVLSAASVNLAAIQNNDTAIALDDTGTNGTIRFITDGTEAGRFTNGNDLQVTNDIRTGAGASVTTGFYYGDGSNLTNISAGSVDLTGTYQSFAGIAVTGPGIALTVTNDVSIGGTVSIGQTAYIDSLVLTQPLDTVVLDNAVIGVATVTGDLNLEGDVIGDNATNISGIATITANDGNFVNVSASSSVTAGFLYGDGSNLTGVIGSGGDGTISGNLTVDSLVVTTGPSTFNGDVNIENNLDINNGAIRLDDLSQINVGDNIDLRIFHSGGNSIIRHDTTGGDLAILSETTVKITNAGFAQTSALFDPEGAAELYHNGSKKFETNASGVVVTGIATADFFYGDGSNLTNISSGSVDLTGTDQEFDSLILTGTVPGGAAGIGLSVVESVSVGSSLTVNTVFAQEYDSLSDENLKFNVLKLDNVLEKLEGIDGVSYTWKNTGAESIGIIAQDVEKVYPELVNKGEVLSVNYNGLVGVLIRAVKELNEKVEDLQRQLDEK